MNLSERMKQEMAVMENQRMALLNHPDIKPLVEMAAEGLEAEHGRKMSLYEKLCLAQVLQNARVDAMAKRSSKLFESTTEDSISFLGIQLPVIAALLPSLVLNDIATTQPMDRRIAAVFYLNVLAGSTKGEVTAADTLMSAKTGHNSAKGARQFAMAGVHRELIGTGELSSETGFTGIYPGLILLENIVLERLTALGVYTTIATCNSSGTLQDVAGDGVTVSGTVVASGAYDITVSGIDSSDEVRLTYYYQYDLPVNATTGEKTGVSEMDVEVAQETVTAIDFPIRTRYSVGASIDLQKAHGINLEDEMVKYLGGSAKFAIDQKGLEMMVAAGVGANAATAVTNWVASIRSGQAWALHCREFVDRLIQGSNNIFTKTKRGVANVCICGNNVARVIRQLTPGFGLEGAFKPTFNWEKQMPTGPIVIGNVTSVNNMVVVQDPYMAENEYTLTYKGDSFLNSAFVYAPYIPLFATPTLITSDLYAQKGFLSSAGFKVTQPGMYCKGTITGIGEQQAEA
jgi:hypothetical protein